MISYQLYHFLPIVIMFYYYFKLNIQSITILSLYTTDNCIDFEINLYKCNMHLVFDVFFFLRIMKQNIMWKQQNGTAWIIQYVICTYIQVYTRANYINTLAAYVKCNQFNWQFIFHTLACRDARLYHNEFFFCTDKQTNMYMRNING